MFTLKGFLRSAAINAAVFAVPFLLVLCGGGFGAGSALGIIAVGLIGLLMFAITAPLRLVITGISIWSFIAGGPALGWMLNIGVDLLALAATFGISTALKVDVAVTANGVLVIIALLGLVRTALRFMWWYFFDHFH